MDESALKNKYNLKRYLLSKFNDFERCYGSSKSAKNQIPYPESSCYLVSGLLPGHTLGKSEKNRLTGSPVNRSAFYL